MEMKDWGYEPEVLSCLPLVLLVGYAAPVVHVYRVY